MEDTPQAETTRHIKPAVLRNLAIALALTSAFMAAQGAVGVFILAGVAALACFAASQLIAKRPLVAALGATLCPPKIGTLSFVRVRVCSELQLRICVWLCVPDLGGPVPDSRVLPCGVRVKAWRLLGLRVARCARYSTN